MKAIIAILCLLTISILGISIAFGQPTEIEEGWTSLAPLPSDMTASKIESAEANGRIYVFGQKQNAAGNSTYLGTYEYNPAENVWLKKAPVPNGTSVFSAAEYQNDVYLLTTRAYVFDGQNILIYHPESNSWEHAVKTISPERQGIDIILLDEKVYLISGQLIRPGPYRTEQPASELTEVYDLKTGSWRTWRRFPCPFVSILPQLLKVKSTLSEEKNLLMMKQ